jgi:hypothetical protein
LHARRQQLGFVDLPRAKFLAHQPTRNQIRRNLTSDYSDKLLGHTTLRSCADQLRTAGRGDPRTSGAVAPNATRTAPDHHFLIEVMLTGVQAVRCGAAASVGCVCLVNSE